MNIQGINFKQSGKMAFSANNPIVPFDDDYKLPYVVNQNQQRIPDTRKLTIQGVPIPSDGEVRDEKGHLLGHMKYPYFHAVRTTSPLSEN